MARPTITIAKTDHARLVRLANSLLEGSSELAEELLGELERASVVEDDAVPADTVQIGSTLEYRMDDGARRRVTLVYPADADIAQGKVSVLTPIGTALLGLASGQTMDFIANDGRKHLLTVVSVEAAANAAA